MQAQLGMPASHHKSYDIAHIVWPKTASKIKLNIKIQQLTKFFGCVMFGCAGWHVRVIACTCKQHTHTHTHPQIQPLSFCVHIALIIYSWIPSNPSENYFLILLHIQQWSIDQSASILNNRIATIFYIFHWNELTIHVYGIRF